MVIPSVASAPTVEWNTGITGRLGEKSVLLLHRFDDLYQTIFLAYSRGQLHLPYLLIYHFLSIVFPGFRQIVNRYQWTDGIGNANN